MKPDLVIGYAVDPTTGTEVFKPVVDMGIPLVLVSNRPKGYTPGKEYIGISTNNPWDNGYAAGEMLAKAMVKEDPNAEIGLLLYEDEYFVLNVMDDAVQEAIKLHAPNLKVHIEGYVDWQMAGQKATALVQKYPGIKGMYATWFDPAMVAVSDLKAIDRGDIQMFTFGMNTPALLDLLDPNGMVKGLSTDFTWNVGMNTAIMGAYGLLGKSAPELVVVPSGSVTADNLRQIWKHVYRGVDLPKEVDDALKKLGK
jgi:ribose transport system substrate-binding protein